MATVAEQLRQGRQSSNLTLNQVAEVLKIRTDHLQALEEGNYDTFPAPVYIRGFVRSYSTLLKLDVPQVMAALESELSKTKKFAEPPRLSDHPRGLLDFLLLQLSKLNWRTGAIVLGALLLAGIGILSYLSWKHHQKADPLKGLKPALYQSNQTVSNETLPLPGPRR